MIGPCTVSYFGKNQNNQNAQSIYLSCQGALWEGGEWKFIESGCKIGDTIETSLNLTTKMVYWLINGNKTIQYPITSSMQGKAAFLSLLTNQKQDEIELSLSELHDFMKGKILSIFLSIINSEIKEKVKYKKYLFLEKNDMLSFTENVVKYQIAKNDKIKHQQAQ